MITITAVLSRLRAGLIATLAMPLLVACASSVGIASTERVNASANMQWEEFLETIPQSTDQQLTEGVRLVAGAVLVASGENLDDWQVALFDRPQTVNAFALPNKRIGIFSGILAHTENPDQLAAVIGHEIAHVRLHHTAERINRGIIPGVLSGVARFPGAVTDIGVLERAGELTSNAVRAGTVLPFDRAQEIEADIEGLTYLAEAGFDPEQAAIFWEQMADAQNASIEVFSTHPSTSRRIRELRKAILKLQEEREGE